MTPSIPLDSHFNAHLDRILGAMRASMQTQAPTGW